MLSTSRQELIHPFTGLRPAQFRKLVRLVAHRGGEAIADGRPGRPWALDLADRVLLVAVYWRTNLTMRQLGPLFGISHSGRAPRPGHPRSAAGVGPGAAPASGAGRHRRRHLDPHPGSPPRRAVEELPLLDQPADRHRR